MSIYKICSKCGENKLLEEFYSNKGRKKNTATYCIPCDRAYYRKNKHIWREQRLKLDWRAKELFRSAKARAEKKGCVFAISLIRVEFALMLGVCERTGLKFDLSSPVGRKFNPFAPSIDKVDPFGDYTDANIQVVCYAYNQGKNQFTDDEYIAFCRRVVEQDEIRKMRLQLAGNSS